MKIIYFSGALKQNSNMLQDVIVVEQHQQYVGVDLA